LIAAAVQALLTADVTPAVTGGASPRLATSTTVALLREAVATGRPLWIGYADKSGMAKEYTVEPLTLTAGFLTAFDAGSSEVRTYTISRITGAQYADTEGGSTP
jgi:predicted DNA-binding transcriptional regulator YafY